MDQLFNTNGHDGNNDSNCNVSNYDTRTYQERKHTGKSSTERVGEAININVQLIACMRLGQKMKMALGSDYEGADHGTSARMTGACLFGKIWQLFQGSTNGATSMIQSRSIT